MRRCRTCYQNRGQCDMLDYVYNAVSFQLVIASYNVSVTYTIFIHIRVDSFCTLELDTREHLATRDIGDLSSNRSEVEV
jgi:hypothetical protein